MTLWQTGEDKLLAQLATQIAPDPRVIHGLGDDCAVLNSGDPGKWLLLKTDAIVGGIHFEEAAAPQKVGWKAMMRPLSDFAAMSGLPEFAVITLAITGGAEASWVRQLYRGLARAGALFRVSIVGGETSATRGPTVISVAVVGRVERNRCVLRRGGKPGDDLFVTGQLGGSISGRHLRFVARISEARWLTRNFRIHAMIDLSDGLGADLPRLAKASRVGFSIEHNDLPRSPGRTVEQAISDGEDYELLFAVPAAERTRLEKCWRGKFPRLRLTRIGALDRTPASALPKLPSGYVHFRERR